MGRMTQNNSTDRPSVWPCLSFRDGEAAIDFLVEAFGFVERASHTEDDTLQAEIGWPSGAGGIMIGAVGAANECAQPSGGGSIYVVTGDPDAVFARASLAGRGVGSAPVLHPRPQRPSGQRAGPPLTPLPRHR